MKDLVELIKGNPGCVAVLDTRSGTWCLSRVDPSKNPHSADSDQAAFDAHERWASENELVHSFDFLARIGDGDHDVSGVNEITQALAVIAGITVMSV